MKKYVFHKYDGENHTRYEKSEEELTSQEEDLLLGEMIKIWENNPPNNQLRFQKMVLDAYLDAYKNEFKQKLMEDEINKEINP